MVGIITEKPSAAKNFAKALGGMEGSFNGEKYVIVNSRGHLFGYKMPEEQVIKELKKKYADWNINFLPWNEKDFKWIREKKTGVDPFIYNIKDKLKGVDEIILATDVDPTGEGFLLGAELIEELSLSAKKYSRMYFVDESVKELQKAFKERKTIPSIQNDREYKMATYRTRFDLLSMQFTRIATACGDGKSVLRQGRLKSAMVKITGDGLKELSNYKKIPYYQNRFRDDNGNIFKNDEEPRFETEEQVPQIYSKSPVVIDSREIKYSKPPKLLDLAALSSILASQGIKAKQVLDVYQKMYDDQVVSYPRTEDKVVSEEQFKELLPLVNKIAAVVGVDKELLTHREARSSHVKNGGAHGANRPGTNVPDKLDDLLKYGEIAPKIYEILAKNYLSILAEDYKYEQQKGHLTLYPSFKGLSNVPLSMGYKAIFNIYNEPENEDEEKTDSGRGLGGTATPFIYQGFPKKPPIPTMKWLMKQLEKHDVGTGATRTSIYADVTDNNTKYPLLIENKGKLSMTEYGEISYQLLPGTHIGDLKITEELQQDMKDIGAGKKKMDECLAKMQRYVAEDIVVMRDNGKLISYKKMTNSSIGKCPICNSDILYGQYGAYCSNKCGMSLSQAFKKQLTEKEVQSLLEKKRTLIKGLSSSNGKSFDAYLTPVGIKKFKKTDGTDGFGWDFRMEYSSKK